MGTNPDTSASFNRKQFEYNREAAISQRVRSICGQPTMIGQQVVRQHAQLRASDYLHILTGSENYRYKIRDRHSINSLREYLEALVTAGADSLLEPILLVRLELLRADPVIEKVAGRGDIFVTPSATEYIDNPAIRNIMDEHMITGGARGEKIRFVNFSPTAHELFDSPATTDKVPPGKHLQKAEEHRFTTFMVTDYQSPT
ncbi:hypothetical protein CRE_05282 [Caenorhabditis remanei]|uniref:Uncharacterized protein n=1 Tax=Caenorhabditis remanei TaxID=31234 RepID=E3NL31_CAERE|nr:hypothetical protein CRE_05282 [Caenorhabditis remanei]